MNRESYQPQDIQKFFKLYELFKDNLVRAEEKGRMHQDVESDIENINTVFENLLLPALIYFINNDTDLTIKVIKWYQQLTNEHQQQLLCHPKARQLGAIIKR